MTDTFVVEVWGKPAGVVLKDGNAFRFHATAAPYFALDGARFSKPGHARLAAASLERRGELAVPSARPRGVSTGEVPCLR